MAKRRNIEIDEERPSLMKIQWIFYFKWLPRLHIHYRTDKIDFSDNIILYAMNSMGFHVPNDMLPTDKDLSDKTVNDFLSPEA